MLLVGDAGVRLRPVADRFTSEADRQISSGMPGVAKKAAGFFAAAFAAVSLGKFLGSAISEATDLGENVSKVGVVFGESAGIIEEFASTASTALGQSRNQALEAAGTFGTLFTGMGIGQAEAASLSTDLVTLASDMASFGNATPQEALDALRSGLVGETEPLRRFGVMLSAAAIEQEAVRLGLAATGEELSASAKAQATYSLAMSQTSIQHGDFQRTSAGLANQQRIMRAQWTDLSTNIGGLFVPALGEAASVITGGFMPGLLRMSEGLPDVGQRIGDLVVRAKDLGGIFSEALADGAAGSSLLAANSLDGLVARAGHNFFVMGQTFSNGWAFLRDSLAPVIGPVLAQLSGAFSTIGAAFSGAFGGTGAGFLATVATALEGLAQNVLPLVVEWVTRWAEVFQAAIPIIVQIVTGLVPVFQTLFAAIGPILQQLIPIISEVAGVFASTILTVLQALAPVIPPLVTAIGQIASVLAGAFMSVLQALAPILPQLVSAIASVATALAGALAGALEAILPVLPPLLDALIQLALAALVPLLPILPLIAQLIMMLVQALAPVIPPVVQIIALLIQLAIQVITPLLPIITMLIEAFVSIVRFLMPIIAVGLQVIGFFMQLRAQVVGAIVGLVTTVVGKLVELVQWFVGLPGRILGALGNFARLLWDKGVDLMRGLVDGIASAASYVGNVAKNIVNGVIGFVNDFIIDGINDLLEFSIAGIEIDVPDIPHIPKLHEGGVFQSGRPEGEGLALLRDNETVVTPEDRSRAAALLAAAGGLGRLAGAGAGSTPAAITIEEHIHQAPGEPTGSVAARVTQSVVWNLNSGITRGVGMVGATT